MSLYGRVEYWNRRYKADKEPYEWYQDYSCIKHLLSDENLGFGRPSRAECRVLILGCGNSRLGEDMLRDNWRGKIVNVDYSPVVIEQMKAKYDERFYTELKAPFSKACRLASIAENQDDDPQEEEAELTKMEYVCADVTETLPFEDGSFDLILCKGTLDSILCSTGSKADVKKMMYECSRILDDNHSAMVVVTYGNADNRIVFFENPENEWWENVDIHKVPQREDSNKKHYVYIAHKNVDTDSSVKSGEENSQEPSLVESPGDATSGNELESQESSEEESDSLVESPVEASPSEDAIKWRSMPKPDQQTSITKLVPLERRTRSLR